jgi:cytochrome c biogenesis protein CcmG/thiol:disulfide interchange protein DsbE
VSKKGVNPVVLGIGALIVLPMLALFWVSFGNDPHALPSVLEGKPAPAFELRDLDGNAVSLASLQGSPVVLNFWSTWCGPCKEEHPILLSAARNNPEVKFFGVIYADDPEKAGRYLKTAGTSYPHLVDETGHAAITYGVAGVPETFFIDAAGRIVHKQVGPVNGQMLAMMLGRLKQESK